MLLEDSRESLSRVQPVLAVMRSSLAARSRSLATLRLVLPEMRGSRPYICVVRAGPSPTRLS